MEFDLFERLAEQDVPPVPSNLDRQVHDRVNVSLLGVHLMEFAFQVLPFAFLHFFQAVIGPDLFFVVRRISSRSRRPVAASLVAHAAASRLAEEKGRSCRPPAVKGINRSRLGKRLN